MAKKQQPRFQNTGDVGTRSFDKSLSEDIKDFHLSENTWTQARNAVNNSGSGDLGGLGNEASNQLCAQAPYTIIGAIHIEADKWAIFSTNNTDSEIGVFEETVCSYTTTVNDPCLAFHTHHLIKGEAREIFDCTFQVYWDDGNNPSRSMNMTNVPWIQDCQIVNDCEICTDTTDLDCNKIRLAPIQSNPCLSIERSGTGGTVFNGSYFVVAAYTVNGQRVTDYSIPSNIQSIFEHDNSTGSLKIIVENMDETYEEFELVIISVVNQTTSARRMGLYSIRQNEINIDHIDDRWPSVGIDLISLRTSIADKSDAMYSVSDYLIRVGPTDKLDFNYQPLANQIEARWASVEYPADYYRKGGNVTSYMRDEIYPFFIRLVWDTGDKTASYHIPGIYADPTGPQFDILSGGDAQIDQDDGIAPYRWRVYNSATVTALSAIPLPDGGVEIAEGRMGYWESSEIYDDNKPDIWNANVIGHPEWDLCGKQIRHHRFPDNYTAGSGADVRTNHFRPNSEGSHIRVMGVRFLNIQPPIDNDGNPITNIVGYEILRGSREGNKTVIAKGMINNMFEYTIPESITPRQGLFPNYPYNDLGARPNLPDAPDPYLTSVESDGDCGPDTYTLQNRLQRYSNKHFTFHSPETQFTDPRLSMEELKVYGAIYGQVDGQFVLPDKHPKHKFVENLAFIAAMIGGLGAAIIARRGKRKINRIEPQMINYGAKSGMILIGQPSGQLVGAQPALGSPLVPGSITPAGLSSNAALLNLYGLNVGLVGTYNGLTQHGLFDAFAGLDGNGYYGALTAGWGAAPQTMPGVSGPTKQFEEELGPMQEYPTWLNIANAIPSFQYYFAEATDAILNIIQAASKFRQHALQYQSHCQYTEFHNPVISNMRKGLKDEIYLTPHLHDFGTDYRINNLQRGTAVALEVDYGIDNVNVAIADDSKIILGGTEGAVTLGYGPTFEDPTVPFNNTRASSHYVALKQRFINQYGQIDSIIQVPVSTCATPKTQTTSDLMFGGDTYIGRYTEKNTFHIFSDWLFAQPDGAQYNYKLKRNVAYPVYWAEAIKKYDLTTFVSSFVDNPLDPPSWDFPSNLRVFDRGACSGLGILGSTLGTGLSFIVKDAYFYLFNSGVRDFFVESEINIDLRDWDDTDTGRHYDPYRYADVGNLFDMSIIRATNLFKYDYSLSISKLYNNYVSWGHTQSRDYDPNVAEQCYTYRQDRVLYSLKQNEELKKDYWKVFLPNNYKPFKSRVTAIKEINKSGALILFENEAPVQFLGVDQLQTDAGTKITIGDGGLFSQPLQNVLNADHPYEYGSCQNRLSVINTPTGVYWMSQNQGKIFQLANGVKEISIKQIKWWLSKFMPYKIVEDFPDFALLDNPIDGVGCQTIYDNKNQMVYFCKKDYCLRDDIQGTLTYDSGNVFLLNGRTRIILGDPRFFEPASWTISYDPKGDNWIGYHDWHPHLLLPGKKSFMSTLRNGIWKHNARCDSFCNFYGIDFPWEVEYTINTIQTVNTLRSIEYQLECYIYDTENCYDRFHDLDFNFDEVVIYNTEQCSGLLRLNLSPKNNPVGIIEFPIINPTWIDILFSKEEQKYRINQFWDITQDRGEFNPSAERVIWNTEPNGYIRNLNPNNLNYNKAETQRKKFRHYTNTVLLRRRISGNRKMIVLLANNKNLRSPR